MKVSIITSVYNNVHTISDAIESVINQTYKNIEYIVVDGNSHDGTKDIIYRYKDNIDYFISEPDKGIYDGLNKGLSIANGDIIGFLHSDDLYKNKHVIQKIVEAFQTHETDAIYGDLEYVKKNDTSQIIRFWKSGHFSQKKLQWGWMPPHPTLFIKKDIYQRYGSFDLSLKIAADYDLILRFFGQEQRSLYYLPETLITMRVGGESNKSLFNILKKSFEDYKALKKNKIGGYHTLIWKNLSKIPQFLQK